MSDTLPTGFAVRLGDKVRVDDGGTALIGGSPTRALYLTPAARAMMRGRELTVADPQTASLAALLIDAGMADPILERLPPADIAELTVVIPAFDRPDALARLLESLGGGARVLVVDDCSTDGEVIASVAQRFGAELLRLLVNEGPAGARNAGLRAVTTPFVAFVDSDMVLDPQTLPTLLRHFVDPRLALVAPRVLGLMEERANWIGRYEDARSSLDMGDRSASVRPLSPVSWLPAACLVARTAAIGDGFGEGMRVAEDVDLVWRLASEGWRIRYDPTVRARHEHRVHLADWLGRKAFYGTGADLLARRHPDNIVPAVLAPWSAAMLLALLAQRRWSIPVALALIVTAAWRIGAKLTRSAHPLRVSARLTGAGVVSAFFQATALLLRHWWPLTAITLLFSRRMRRAALVAAVADVAMEYTRVRPRLDPLRFALLRRLDDLAYGAGLWWGALRGRSARSLLPRLQTSRRPPGR